MQDLPYTTGLAAQIYRAPGHRSRFLARMVEGVAACDVKDEKRRFVLEELHIPRFTTRFEEVVQAPDVELVLITTPMPEHGPIAKAALEAGEHVLTEKPMAVTLDEAVHLVQLAKNSPGNLVCAPPAH